MKFLLSSIIICAMLGSANQVLAINYQDSLSNSEEINVSQLSAAKLLQNYLETYKKKINDLHNAYQGTNNIAISTFNSQLSTMSQSLYDIQNNRVSSVAAKVIIAEIVSDLKLINTRMKVFLEQEKILYEQKIQIKQKELSKIGLKITRILDGLLLSVSNSLLDKNSLSSKEKKLVQSLIELRKQNNNMKAFATTTFQTEQEMRQYLQNVIGSIRAEFQKIKNL